MWEKSSIAESIIIDQEIVQEEKKKGHEDIK
jgi:hypothetical protein